jgi:hypothetical protein
MSEGVANVKLLILEKRDIYLYTYTRMTENLRADNGDCNCNESCPFHMSIPMIP